MKRPLEKILSAKEREPDTTTKDTIWVTERDMQRLNRTSMESE